MKKVFYYLFAIVLLQITACKKDTNGNTTTVTVVPIAPTNLIGQAISTSKINLAWTDNSTNEDGFKIERKIANGTYALIGNTAVNITNYTDSNLAANTVYTYRVYGFNAAGSSLTYTNELTISTQDPIAQTINNGLVAYYPFNGNANDESGNGNNGIISGGVTTTSDRFGSNNKAYFFNGIDGYISVPSLNSLKYKPTSYSAWVILSSFFPNSFGHKFKTILGRQTAFITDCGAIGFYADNNNFNGLCDNNFLMWGGGGAPYTNTTFNLNTWIHLVWTQDTNGDWKWYVNGNLTNSGNFPEPLNYFNFFRIGGCNNQSNGNTFWDNKIDDIRIYNRALTQSEVTYLYNH